MSTKWQFWISFTPNYDHSIHPLIWLCHQFDHLNHIHEYSLEASRLFHGFRKQVPESHWLSNSHPLESLLSNPAWRRGKVRRWFWVEYNCLAVRLAVSNSSQVLLRWHSLRRGFTSASSSSRRLFWLWQAKIHKQLLKWLSHCFEGLLIGVKGVLL